MSNQYHSIIFYTTHPEDKISQAILVELKKYTDLKDQIRLICVSNPNLKLPSMIMEMDTFPVIVTRGFDQPLMGEHALSWIKEGHFSGKTTSEGYGDINNADKTDDDFGTLATESSRTEYHQAFNEDWNRDGVDQSPHVINSTFSSIDESQNMDTFEEGKSKVGGQVDSAMRRLQMQRDSDVPPPVRPGVGPLPGTAGPLPGTAGPLPGLADGRGPPSSGGFPSSTSGAPPPSLSGNQLGFDTRGGAMPPPAGVPNFQHPLANPRPPPYGGFAGPGQGPGQSQSQSQGQSQNKPFPADTSGNFPPPPPANPMVPQHPGSMHPPPGNAFPPQVQGPGPGPGGTGSDPSKASNVPALPSGFGVGTSLNDAYGGMSLLGTGEINNQHNPRREQLMNPGLPTGRGRMGPNQGGLGTRSF